MRSRTLALVLVLATTVSAHALTLESPRVEAVLVDWSSKDPFRMTARIAGIDPMAMMSAPMTLRFGSLVAHIPANGFRRRKGAYTWRSYLSGVKKVTIRVSNATLEIVGGDVELGSLPSPVTIAIEMPDDLLCGRITWTSETVLRPKQRFRRAVRKLAIGPLDSCAALADGSDHTPPHVTITSPTGFDGYTVATPTVTLGGLVIDDTAVAGLAWSNDRGGGASVVPSREWTIADIALQAGDNRITVSATDTA